MYVNLCRHIKTNGLQCRGVAIKGSAFCYFHRSLHQRHTNYFFTPATQGYLVPGRDIQLCPVEDRESVQIAISLVVNALATGNLEVKRASVLLRGLQLAAANSSRLSLDHDPQRLVRNALAAPENSNSANLDLADPGRVYHIGDEDPDPDETQDDTDDPNHPAMGESDGQPLAASPADPHPPIPSIHP